MTSALITGRAILPNHYTHFRVNMRCARAVVGQCICDRRGVRTLFFTLARFKIFPKFHGKYLVLLLVYFTTFWTSFHQRCSGSVRVTCHGTNRADIQV